MKMKTGFIIFEGNHLSQLNAQITLWIGEFHDDIRILSHQQHISVAPDLSRFWCVVSICYETGFLE
jgi:hypothetical protein